jgi:hypothetical protein
MSKSYCPGERQALPVQHQKEHEQDPACATRPGQKLGEQHAPVRVERAVSRVGDGRGAQRQEHRVEEGERADRHRVGLRFQVILGLLIATRAGEQTVPRGAQQNDGNRDNPEEDAAPDAKERAAALGQEE